MKIKVGAREIGEGCKPFIIAEVGSNWSTFEDCKDSIAKAAACGADAVKFQVYGSASLYGFGAQKNLDGTFSVPTELGWTSEQYEAATRVDKHRLPLDWLPRLAEKAKACGIEFMCSAFSPELYEAVDPYVSIHKVASAELTHKRILEKLRKLGKPVILSTGASGENDIRGALKLLEGVPVVLLQCTAAYPARESNPWAIPILREKFGKLIGFSDHSIDATVTPVVAIHQGAVVLEKHVNFVGAIGPDSPHSLSTDEFMRMVEAIGRAPTEPKTQPEEMGMILRHNRRLIATRDIQPGQPLLEGQNFGIYRSLKDDTKAAHPFMIDEMVGKPVKRFIPAGDGIAPQDV